MEIIKLEQTPRILHKLQEAGKNVTTRISELDLENQVATEDTVKSLKSLRAELTKEAKKFEEQRKFVKNSILKPYAEFEDVYKTEIINKYKQADELLKSKINGFEMGIKKAKRDNLIAYFNELCEVEKIDWLKFDSLGIEFGLSTSEKKYKEQVNEIIGKIVSDLELIKTDEYSAEILVEYKKTQNASKAIQDIRARKEAEKQEKARIKAETTQKRVDQLRSLSFIFNSLTKTYNNVIDEQIMVSLSVIENSTNEEWVDVYAELSALSKPKEEKATVLQAPKEVAPEAPKPQEQKQEKKQPQVFKASFEITDTYERLKLLQEFLKSNNYKYKNI